jgi:hypothetical protein
VADESDDAGCGRPEWKVWISEVKVMMAGDRSVLTRGRGEVGVVVDS